MGRYLEASCKVCRRNKEKLFLKGARCHTAKCAIEKRNFPPGIRTNMPKKMSEYGKRLREKQKLRFLFGISEVQMRNYFDSALNQKGVTGSNLLKLLESRFDNALFRSKFAMSRKDARQLIRHGHFSVNGRKVNIPSYSLKQGDIISLKTENNLYKERFKVVKEKGVPTWMAFDEQAQNISVVHLPEREEIDVPVQEQLIVEFYSM